MRREETCLVVNDVAIICFLFGAVRFFSRVDVRLLSVESRIRGTAKWPDIRPL